MATLMNVSDQIGQLYIKNGDLIQIRIVWKIANPGWEIVSKSDYIPRLRVYPERTKYCGESGLVSRLDECY